MTLEPNDLLLFARVVDEGSFSRAAERLKLPKSTVSRRVTALEAQLGERLLLRTTRKLAVTEFGLAVLEHAHHVVEDVAAAESLAQTRQIEPSGRLRVSMPSDMANIVLAPLLAEFVLKYPAIALEIDLSALRRPDRREHRRRRSHGRIARRPSYRAAAVLTVVSTPRRVSCAAVRHPTGSADGTTPLRILARTGDPMRGAESRRRTLEGIPPGRATANSPAP
jgi:DNA-binding transcriptional LysR family regulator